MNPLLRLFAVGTLLLTAVSSFAADGFQGKVTLAITDGKGRTHDMNYSIKGQKLRMDMSAEGHEVATIMDLEKLEMLMLMTEQKKYMVMPIKKPVERAAAKAKDYESTAEVEVTGKTETILGYKCNQILVKDKGTVSELWVAEGLGVFMGLGNNGGGGGGMGGMFGGKKSANAAKWEEALKGKGGFPLRVVTHDAKSKEVFKMEATKIEPGTLPDSLFLPPAGYERFQMPDMGSLLKGFGG
jgi:hypothetical protein